MSLPLPLVGPTYTNRSLPVSSQTTQNFYVEVNPQGKEIISLMPFPGLVPFSTVNNGVGRGLGVLNEVLYSVSGNGLYEVSRAGVATLIGTIEGSGRCNLASDATNLVIVTGEGKPYTYDGTTLAQGTDVDLPDAATVAYLNRRVIYDGTGPDVAFADLNNPLSVNSANVISTDTTPDDMLAGFVQNQQYYACCAASIEPYYNVGTGNPPYQLIQNAVKDIGIHAIHSIGQNKQYTYFLGSDRQPYRLQQLTLEPISNPAIGRAIESYAASSSAFGFCFTWDSQEFWVLSFPEQTWLWNESASLWTNISFGADEPHLANDYAYVYGKHLVSDRRNGNILEMDADTYTDAGETIFRRRDTISIDGATFGKADARVFMDRLRLRIDPGPSLVDTEAMIMMQYSDDNGRTWSSERWAKVGQQGDYGYIVEWLALGDFYRRMFRFTMTDPINWVLISASADVELGFD